MFVGRQTLLPGSKPDTQPEIDLGGANWVVEELELSNRDSGMTSELDQTTRLPGLETRRWVPCSRLGGPLTGVVGKDGLDANNRLY